MLQQTHQEQVHDHEKYKPVTENDQVFTTILKSCSQVIRKMAVSAVNGFHNFVESAEYPNNRRDEYWWESPESAEKIIKG